MKNTVMLFFLVFIGMGTNAQAEQGCPPGQYPIGGQGVAACAPIPQENSIQQEPRASGKWIKTWGAIASDGGDNLGVAKGKLTKSDAQEEALSKCKSVSGKECQIDFVYKNQCTAIAEPHKNENAVPGVLSYTGGPTVDVASSDALANCNKHNKGLDCRVIYQACSEPYFQKY
ncbi:DUF4189 domain-containing protein [Xanthomonas arboricola]|uniref:DUF4189 domain-containing protein n=1 Tax=Gammaproteobacteria TaxID=1236 RepID=UPI000A90CDD0|nr:MULTISPECIES: DUF4189 domain-containing protein [Gammaproteobacteria]MEA5150784.1 DUF4189 domain-containing protein [Xanthomonas arboricola]UQP98437.1 DUF4189 domain-containing protein [Xanthomonas arboricola pv. juglandis]UQQ04340.1 DUF4189 domain-containing protein [Xanthomonas arboricola pv. juglandis]CAD7381890.1 DUF4189 domain-containing protein [Xanthomonas arboricola]